MKINKNNPFLVLIGSLLVVLLLAYLIVVLQQRSKTVHLDAESNLTAICEEIIDEFVQNRATWYEFSDIAFVYKGYDDIELNNPEFISFDLLYDANNEVYIWSSRISYYPDNMYLERKVPPQKTSIDYKSQDIINLNDLYDVNELIEIINEKYSVKIIEYFKSNYVDIRCTCNYSGQECDVYFAVDSESNTYIQFEIDLNTKELKFIEKNNLDLLPIKK